MGRLAHLGQQASGEREARAAQAVAGGGSFHLTAHEPGLLQDLQMLRNGGLCQLERIHDLATETAFPCGQEPKDAHPHRMRQPLGQPRQGRVGLRTVR